jgi:outer membrane protein assembly factor BamA
MTAEALALVAATLVGLASRTAFAAEPAVAPADAGNQDVASPADWFAIPIAFYLPETRMGFGATGGVHFHVRPALQTSDLQAIATGTLREQALLALTAQIFPSEQLAVGGLLRMSLYPDFFWGVGNDASARAKESFTSRSVELQLSPERYLLPRRLRTGPRLWYRQESFRGLAPDGQLASGAVSGVDDYTAAGAGWSLSWDTRDNRFFPRRGNAVEAWYVLASRVGGGGGRFGRGAVDVRQFVPLGSRVVLGVAGHGELSRGDVPITLLPRLGGDQNLRGYYLGRWRDRFMYSGQAELRFPLAGRLGGAAFAGVSDVAGRLSGFEARTIRAAAGLGGRYRLTDDGVNIRLDVGVGAEGANVYLNLGEAF